MDTATYPTNGVHNVTVQPDTVVALEAVDGTGQVTITTVALDDLRALSTLTRRPTHALLADAVEHLRNTVAPSTRRTEPRTPGTPGTPGRKAK